MSVWQSGPLEVPDYHLAHTSSLLYAIKTQIKARKKPPNRGILGIDLGVSIVRLTVSRPMRVDHSVWQKYFCNANGGKNFHGPKFCPLNRSVFYHISMIHIDLISCHHCPLMSPDVTVITGIQSWKCFVSVRSNQSFHQSEEWAAEDLNIIGPLASRIPTAKSGISRGLQDHSPVHHYQGERGGAGRKRYKLLYSSFKWGLKTGHFYRFIRTFRTS